VVIIFQIIYANVSAKLDIAEETEAGIAGNAVKCGRHGLDLLMVGRNAISHKAKWGWQTVKHIDLYDHVGFFKQPLGRIKSGRASTDNSDAKWLRRGSELGHGIITLLLQ
jgi:hypothetical protein